MWILLAIAATIFVVGLGLAARALYIGSIAEDTTAIDYSGWLVRLTIGLGGLAFGAGLIIQSNQLVTTFGGGICLGALICLLSWFKFHQRLVSWGEITPIRYWGRSRSYWNRRVNAAIMASRDHQN